MKQVGIFCFFLAVQVIVKMFPLYGKEQTKNCRKNMSKDKSREVCENDKFKKKKERQQKKLVTLREMNGKRIKDREQQGARIGRVPYKGKKKSGQGKKTMQLTGKVAYKNKQAKYN